MLYQIIGSTVPILLNDCLSMRSFVGIREPYDLFLFVFLYRLIKSAISLGPMLLIVTLVQLRYSAFLFPSGLCLHMLKFREFAAFHIVGWL